MLRLPPCRTGGAGGDGATGHGRASSPGLQAIHAVCEVTGGGEKVYAIAAEYDAALDPASLRLDTYHAAIVPAAKGYFPGMPDAVDKNAIEQKPVTRRPVAVYTNARPALSPGQTGTDGRYVIIEFTHDDDLSLPTRDSEKVTLRQEKPVRTQQGRVYPASRRLWSNAGRHGNSVVIRGVDAWEQNHWWWDDSRSAGLEYSIYLPKSFLAEGGDKKSYPLLLAITHSGTSYEGTCAQTLTEQCIASIWSLPEEQAGGKVVRPRELLDPSLIFPLGEQGRLTAQIESYLAEKGNITFLTFRGVDHMASARKFFYIKAARRWLFSQVKG